MAESLDQRVAQAVLDARLLERALHDSSARWGMRWRGLTVPAERHVTEDSVTFYASFPALDDDGNGDISLLMNGVEVRVRPIDVAGRAALDFDWSLALPDRRVLSPQ